MPREENPPERAAKPTEERIVALDADSMPIFKAFRVAASLLNPIVQAFLETPLTRVFLFVFLLALFRGVAILYVIVSFLVGFLVAIPDFSQDAAQLHYQHALKSLVNQRQHSPTALPTQSSNLPVSLLLPNPLKDTLNRVLSLISRDFIESWYGSINRSGDRQFQNGIQNLCRTSINNLTRIVEERCTGVNLAFIVCNIGVTCLRKHVHTFKVYQQFLLSGEIAIANELLSLTHQQELAYLNTLADFLFTFLLPEEEKGCELANTFLKELLSSVILQELVDLLADPAFLNQQVIDHLDFERDKLFAKSVKGYSVLRIKALRGRNLLANSIEPSISGSA